MLRYRRCILTELLSSPSASTISPLHRLISAAAPAVSPNPSFVVEEYRVYACGLTRPQALKASAKISHLKSPAKPDAVLAFLAGLGLSSSEVAGLVAKDPLLLCARVEKTLSPVVVGLTGLGLSLPEIPRLAPLAGSSFRCRSIVSNVHYYLSLLGSSEKLIRALKRSSYLIGADLDRKIKPNVALLHECGLDDCEIANLCIDQPRVLYHHNLEHIRQMVACAAGLGVPRCSGMFRHVLRAVAFLNKEKVAAKVDYLKKTFRWSDTEVGVAVCKVPSVLTISDHVLQSKSEFLISEVGLERGYIAYRPAMLTYSLDGSLRPRYHVVNFLKKNGLLDRDRDYYSAVMRTEKVFMEKYISPHKEAAPHLAEDYTAACRGEVPARFIFT